MKSVLLVPSDVPDLLQAMSFAFLAAVTSLPSERCANKKQAQVELFPKHAKEILTFILQNLIALIFHQCLNTNNIYKLHSKTCRMVKVRKTMKILQNLTALK